MTKTERIHELLDQVEEDTRKATLADIIADLKDFAKDASAANKPGMLEAIQILKANYC